MEEHLDIVDENDKVIGTDSRTNIYAQGKGRNIRVINILLFNDKGELLVPKRSMNRRLFPGRYDFSCGEHVVSGEEYYPAAIRGLKEELGLENLALEELGKIGHKEGASSFMKIYKLIYNGKVENYDKKGIASLNYFSIDKIKSMMEENINNFKPDFPVVLNWYLKRC